MEETGPDKQADHRSSSESTKPQNGLSSRRHWIHRSEVVWTAYVALCLSLFLVGVVFGRLSSTRRLPGPQQNRVPASDQAFRLKPGPWGDLEAIPIYIEPPEEYLPIQEIAALDSRWFFEGYSSKKLTAFFDAITLPPEQKAELLDPAHCVSTTNGMIVTPSREAILSLSPEQRKQIYGILNQGPARPMDKVKVWFPADSFEEHFERSGLSKETIALVRKLCFPYGKLLVFCDAKTVLEMLNSYDEKALFLKTLLRKHTLLLKLHVTPDTNIDSLLSYWGRAAQGKELRPFLQSLASVPGGTTEDLVHLLPHFPKENLYEFPPPSTDPVVSRHDCNWTAFNFFRDPPDERFTERDFIENTLRTDYYPISSDPRYGDIMLLQAEPNTIIHAAVFVADNIVYTKNGTASEPFLFMTIQDLLDTFAALIPEGQRLGIVYLRNKYY